MAPTEKKERKKSNCWLFFTKSDEGGTCKICHRDIRTKGNTTNLRLHLKRNHSDQWDSIEGDEASAFIESAENHEGSFPGNQTQPDLRHAYQSGDGSTVFYLQPSYPVDNMAGHDTQNSVNTEENATILSSGEVVQKQTDESQKMSEADKNEGGVKPRRKYARQAAKKKFATSSSPVPSPALSPGAPIRTVVLAGGNTAPVKEDLFDHFGRYIACLLRSMPSKKAACHLQKEIINWVIQEQMQCEVAPEQQQC